MRAVAAVFVAVLLFIFCFLSIANNWAAVIVNQPGYQVHGLPWMGAFFASIGIVILPGADRRLIAVPWLLDPYALPFIGLTLGMLLEAPPQPIPRAIARPRAARRGA